jgi:EAL domain-containing protein (putative c-di-GMP-specific phosphodiesterase class I)
VIAALIADAKHSGARLIAEGIETHTQACRLAALGVELGQGFASPARFTVTLGARRDEISGCPSHAPGCHGQQRERGQGGQ